MFVRRGAEAVPAVTAAAPPFHGLGEFNQNETASRLPHLSSSTGRDRRRASRTPRHVPRLSPRPPHHAPRRGRHVPRPGPGPTTSLNHVLGHHVPSPHVPGRYIPNTFPAVTTPPLRPQPSRPQPSRLRRHIPRPSPVAPRSCCAPSPRPSLL